jgi:hypothetical protein
MYHITNQIRGIENINGEKLAKYVEHEWSRYLYELKYAETLEEVKGAYMDFYNDVATVMCYEFDIIEFAMGHPKNYQDLDDAIKDIARLHYVLKLEEMVEYYVDAYGEYDRMS